MNTSQMNTEWRAHSVPTRPSFALLTIVEMRKSVDTRAGRWFLAVLALLGAAVLAYQAWNNAGEPVTFERFHSNAMSVVRLVLPVLGVLLMTGEWTQRAAMTTFALTPRRGRVLAAKITAAAAVPCRWHSSRPQLRPPRPPWRQWPAATR